MPTLAEWSATSYSFRISARGGDCVLISAMTRRKKFTLRLPSRKLVLGERTLIMGVLNVTPDSFSDGGQFLDARSAVEHAFQMERDGADLLDIG
ncbi:MAG: dihydropteroate synthase, partial [Candidatus Acidiferrales bacterium]